MLRKKKQVSICVGISIMIAYTHFIFVFWRVFLPTIANGADILAGGRHGTQRAKNILATDQGQVKGLLVAIQTIEIDHISV